MNKNDKSVLIDEFVEDIISHENHESEISEFKTLEMIKEQRKQELTEFLKSDILQMKLKDAIELILNQSNDHLTKKESDNLFEELKKINNQRLDEFSNKDHSNITSIQELFSLSDNTLRYIYKIGFNLFKDGRTDEAENIFLLLVTLNSNVPDFLHALGLCFQKKEERNDAIAYFLLAIEKNPNHIPSRISLIESYLQNNDIQNASIHFDEIKSNQEIPEKWKEKISNIEKQLK